MKLRQDRVLGTLLGMAIGDALGMPVEGWPRETVRERYGIVDTYYERKFDDGTRLKAGEFTDDSEGVLCIVESYTANTGEFDAENIRARLEILARGESRRWMKPSTFDLLDLEPDSNGSLAEEAVATGDVAARGIALGLVAAGSPQPDASRLRWQAALLASLTHRSADSAEAVELVAEAIRSVALEEVMLPELPGYLSEKYPISSVASLLAAKVETGSPGWVSDRQFENIGFGDSAASVIATAVLSAARSLDFQHAVFTATSLGGAADSRGAIAGALAGAAYGTAGIPQWLIDGLEGRVYIMLAAPWFFQTIQLRNAYSLLPPQQSG